MILLAYSLGTVDGKCSEMYASGCIIFKERMLGSVTVSVTHGNLYKAVYRFMDRGVNYFSSVAWFSAAILSSGLYLGAFHFLPSAAWLFFSLTLLFGFFGLIKVLNLFAPAFSPFFHRLICWIHSLSFELFSVVIAFLMRPLGFGSEMTRWGPCTGRPILLIHGYLQNGTNWNWMKRQLSKRGFGPLYALSLSPPFQSIREYAQFVAQKAEEIAKETGRSDLALICHSMGGLVGSWYAAKVAPPGKVSEVVTIGSPMGGTILARFAIGPNGREMEVGSDFSKELQGEIASAEKTLFYHIASRADQIILPYSSALTGLCPEREFLVDDIGHMTLLFSPRVADKIQEWLAL